MNHGPAQWMLAVVGSSRDGGQQMMVSGARAHLH